ncbi:MAG: hypothetical protein F6K26_33110 [Moorea sp. SIO2I5]|nr:hypothetical protein [Moorena sp. SIO2I5]
MLTYLGNVRYSVSGAIKDKSQSDSERNSKKKDPPLFGWVDGKYVKQLEPWPPYGNG